MDTILENHRSEFESTVNHFKEELASVRTGRATPALVENILIEAYGTKTPLRQLASINTPDSRTLMVDPWDKSVIKEIEKDLNEASLGFSVTNEGKNLRLTIATLTEETRNDLIKALNQKAENTRKNVRGLRDKIKEEIQEAEKDKEITEDDRYKLQKDLDELTNSYNVKIKEMVEKKEIEVKTI